MTAFNVVRLRVKAGREEDFRRAREGIERKLPGLRKMSVIKTGDRAYCIIGEWDGMQALAAARPAMIANLDKMRDMLEDLGGGLGVTDPVSGEVVSES
jgi:hypothetical protein